MFRNVSLCIGIFCLFFVLSGTADAAVTRTKIVVPKVVRTLPPKKVVKKVTKSSLVHTKILDANPIDPNKMSF
jgi:hypothetical protein